MENGCTGQTQISAGSDEGDVKKKRFNPLDAAGSDLAREMNA